MHPRQAPWAEPCVLTATFWGIPLFRLIEFPKLHRRLGKNLRTRVWGNCGGKGLDDKALDVDGVMYLEQTRAGQFKRPSFSSVLSEQGTCARPLLNTHYTYSEPS